MNPLIQFKDICKSFKNNLVLDNLNLDVYKNEIFGLVGTSGAGKTTLMRVLMGFYEADKGTIIFNSLDITKRLYLIRRIIGYTTQENSFYPKLTIRENLYYYGNMYNIPHKILKSRVPELLKLTKLEKFRGVLAGDISGGMKRRVDFAISLIHDPPLLILDEPTTGLDPLLRESIWEIIRKVRDNGKTVIVSSHFFDELEKNCSRIGVLSKGKIAYAANISWYKKNFPKEKSFVKIFERIVKHDTNDN